MLSHHIRQSRKWYRPFLKAKFSNTFFSIFCVNFRHLRQFFIIGIPYFISVYFCTLNDLIVIFWQTHFQACQIFLTILLVHNFTPIGRRLQNAFGIENTSSSQTFVPNIAQNIFYTAYLCLGNLVDCRAH